MEGSSYVGVVHTKHGDRELWTLARPLKYLQQAAAIELKKVKDGARSVL